MPKGAPNLTAIAKDGNTDETIKVEHLKPSSGPSENETGRVLMMASGGYSWLRSLLPLRCRVMEGRNMSSKYRNSLRAPKPSLWVSSTRLKYASP